MIKKSDFRKRIFVKCEEDANEKYYVSSHDIELVSAENGDYVAVYELVEIKKLRITTELV